MQTQERAHCVRSVGVPIHLKKKIKRKKKATILSQEAFYGSVLDRCSRQNLLTELTMPAPEILYCYSTSPHHRCH